MRSRVAGGAEELRCGCAGGIGGEDVGDGVGRGIGGTGWRFGAEFAVGFSVGGKISRLSSNEARWIGGGGAGRDCGPKPSLRPR